MTEEQLSALLRLKRFEQPPPEYFDRLLENVHRRQREELLRRPLWKIALERVQMLFSEHSMGGLSYAGAMASTLVIGVGTIWMMSPVPRPGVPAGPIAKTEPAQKLLSLGQSNLVALPVGFATQDAESGRGVTAKDRRYVIDARPPSYEPAASIEF